MKVEEERYNLPEGWIWTTIGELALLSSGGTPDRGNRNYFKGDIPWVKSGELNYNTITVTEENISQEALENSSAKIVPSGTLLIALYGSTVGKLAYLGIMAATNQAVASLVTTESLESKYLYYYLLHNREMLLQKRVGGAQPNISQKILQIFPIPLTIQLEQQLIVNQIELLFSKLEEAEKVLKEAKKALSVYKYALLKNVFEGKLTTKWREENSFKTTQKILGELNKERENYYENALIDWKEKFSQWEKNGKDGQKPFKTKEFQSFPYIEKDFDELPKLPKEWKWIHWNEILDYTEDSFKRGPFGSALTKSIFVKTGYKVYEQYCAINDDCSFERYYITPEKYEELKAFSVNEGDYLISCAGTIGRITQIPQKYNKGVINQALLRLRVNKKYINNKFFLYFFRSPYFQKQIFDNSKGSAIPNIKGVKELKVIPIPLLSIEEQNVIVEILDSRFTLVDHLQKTVDNVLNEIIALKHSILKKAFEGKLVNYTSNESVENLLHDIQKEKELYIEKQNEFSRSKPKKKLKMEEKKSILDILKESDSPIPAKDLWEKSTSEGDIERFYSEIKEIYDKIDEVKSETESLLTIRDENK